MTPKTNQDKYNILAKKNALALLGSGEKGIGAQYNIGELAALERVIF